jgi:hypothetical protein
MQGSPQKVDFTPGAEKFRSFANSEGAAERPVTRLSLTSDFRAPPFVLSTYFWLTTRHCVRALPIFSCRYGTQFLKTRRRYTMRRFLVSLCLGTALMAGAGLGSASAQQSAAAGIAAQTAVSTISYQGVLAKDGVAVPDGDYTITVTLYHDAAGSGSAWSGMYIVHTSNGVFNLLLGSGDYPLPAASKLDGPLYVGVKIGEGAELPITQLSSAVSAVNVADNSITAKKMGTDYIGSISINGQRFSTRGGDVNIITGDGMLATVDEATNSIVLSATGGSSSISGKGANPQTGVSYVVNGTGQQNPASFNISGSGQIGTTLTVGGPSTFNGNLLISNSNTLSVGGTSNFNGSVNMADGLSISGAPLFSSIATFFNTLNINASEGTGNLLLLSTTSNDGYHEILRSPMTWDGSMLAGADIDGTRVITTWSGWQAARVLRAQRELQAERVLPAQRVLLAQRELPVQPA